MKTKNWWFYGAALAGIGGLVLLTRKSLPAASMPLDNNLSAEQKLAIRFAINNDPSSSNLTDFANTLTPDFPLAAEALNTRALELRSKQP